MTSNITFLRRLDQEEVSQRLQNVVFRGVYGEDGSPLKPYSKAKFSLATVHPPLYPTSFPQIYNDLHPNPLFTSQPTIYNDQLAIIEKVDQFLQTIDKHVFSLEFEGIEYNWEGKGKFHVLPPIVEKHTYPLTRGSFDLKKMAQRFQGAFVRDAKGNMHELSKSVLRDFFVDAESKAPYLNVFNHNAELLNYGLQFTGPHTFYVICDGSHRLDYAIEKLNKPINVILVEGESLLPYYAFPVPFRPTTRLTSKDAERMYPRIERDKIHLLNDLIKKVLHYNWEEGDLSVSSLRQKTRIH